MDHRTILDALTEVYPDEVELRPDIAATAARAAAEDKPLILAKSEEGDAFLDPEIVDLIYKAALFVAAVVKASKDSYELGKAVAEDVRKSDLRFSKLPQDSADKLAKKALQKNASNERGGNSGGG